MKILLLGATGRTGKLVLEKALESRYEVNCLSRNSERIEPQEGLTIFEGNPNNKTDLENALTECDFVVNVLNISRKSDFPWATIRTPENYLPDVMNTLIPIAEDNHLKRIVVCSAWGVAETKNDIPKWFRWLIENSNIRVTYQDHERQEELLKKSDLNWTIIRPTGLTNSKKEQNIRETFEKIPKPSLTISRQSVAVYIINSIKDTNLMRKTVVISKE